jgi:hypothetical protein
MLASSSGGNAAVGLFDTVWCRYRLPDCQDAEFQTKDLAGLVCGESMLGGLMDEYEITQDGRLRRRSRRRKLRDWLDWRLRPSR